MDAGVLKETYPYQVCRPVSSCMAGCEHLFPQVVCMADTTQMEWDVEVLRPCLLAKA